LGNSADLLTLVFKDLEKARVCRLFQSEFAAWAEEKPGADSCVAQVMDVGSLVTVELVSWAVNSLQLRVSLENPKNVDLSVCVELSARRPRGEERAGLLPSETSGLHVLLGGGEHGENNALSRQLAANFRPHLELSIAKNQAFVGNGSTYCRQYAVQQEGLQPFALFISRLIRVQTAEERESLFFFLLFFLFFSSSLPPPSFFFCRTAKGNWQLTKTPLSDPAGCADAPRPVGQGKVTRSQSVAAALLAGREGRQGEPVYCRVCGL
jgi:hypothetical protein